MEKKGMILVLSVLVILIVSVLIYMSQGLKRMYKAEVLKGLTHTAVAEKSILEDTEIAGLPEPVRKYLAYTGSIGKEKVHNMRIAFFGEFKSDPKRDWFKIESVQYNFFGNNLSRIFLMNGKMFGIPVMGLHTYTNEIANMLIKAAGLITVVDAKGSEARISDTVTLLNDMCCLAPATLTDKRIQWETVDPLTVKAVFDNNGCKVSAMLYFNDKGELINFISDDRYMVMMDGTIRKARWSTPIRDYKDIGGIKILAYGEAIWNLPEGDYCYAKFNFKEVEYNCKDFK
jgi:hypothetical protein